MPFVNDLIEHNRAQAGQPVEPARQQAKASRFLFEVEAVMALLRGRIVGQPAVLDAVEAMLRVVKADLGDPERPLAVNLFVGPTGVGKTEIVRLLALAIHGRADAFCRIDMGTLAQDHYASALTGAPPGYVGSKEGSTLLDAEAIAGSFSRPGIVLFDELEKAGPEVIRSLLGVLDSGQLRLTAGSRTLDFRNALVFFTSNAGAREAWAVFHRHAHGWRRWLRRSAPAEQRTVEAALEQRLDPEFLNRLDRVLLFQRLDRDWYDAVLSIELARLNERLGRRGGRVELAAEARRLLCADPDPRYGAREIARRLRTRLQPVLAEALLHAPQVGAWRIAAVNGALQAEPLEPDTGESQPCAQPNSSQLLR
ncbi:AAA family ATPase [Stutzerimonas balearica]|jgi:ATP-dependent Clp protease ATP-binding subunit ClpA|uniref:AAA family ATPase n=1 Tax=Stutzerimonas balearica TaxID=74829 RepID=UPI000C430A56|nr:AAA family ATPase [Pseudomonas sp.]